MNGTGNSEPFPTIGQPNAEGLFFVYGFDADGYACDVNDATWTWRSYHLTDLGARRALTDDVHMPREAKSAFLSRGSECHIDLDDGWLHGDMPDLRHDCSSEARGLGHFRFAFNSRTLIGARKQPLDSVELIRAQVKNRTRAFRSPAELIEAVMAQSLSAMSAELSGLGTTLDGIEYRIVSDAWHNERHALVDVRRRMIQMHRQMVTLAGLFRHLEQAHQHDLPEEFAEFVTRVSHRVFTLHHDGAQLQARARLLQDELMAKLTAQSNQLLYLLSVMTAVLLPTTIVASLFGMNVGGLPFTQTRAGFWIVTVISVMASAGALWFVRRIGRDGR